MRTLKSWLDGYMQFTEPTGTPMIFRRWAGIFAIAAALERKVWIRNKKGLLYPNLYMLLIGPPGAGKGVALDPVHSFISQLDDCFVAPTSVSKASLMDCMLGAEKKIVRPQDNPPVTTINALNVISNEFGSFLPEYASEFMNTLTDVWDNKGYSEAKRTANRNFAMPNASLNLIAGTTPSYLNSFLPDGAWDQGFLARTLLIYSGANDPTEIFGDEVVNDALLHKVLLDDLKKIQSLFGKMTFTKEAAEALNAWHIAKGPPAPDHPKLVHYNIRRTANLLKLCMIACAACGDEMVVTLDNYAEALDWLLHMEHQIPDIFKSMTAGGDGRVMQETWHFAYQFWIKDKKPIREHVIVEFLMNKTPAHNVAHILGAMVRGKVFDEVLEPGIGKTYRPRPPKRAA